ncbi:MAG: DNA-processing protein DprA, partial [Bacteroidales bacterium]|nr:DNA-processing protein DprA [Bacteroidales bacterium]
IRRHQVRTFLFGEDTYPFRLGQCPDAPLVLFGRGELPFNLSRQLAVVGSRHPTDYGLRLAQQTVRELADFQPVVVSGLAQGVDGAAHRSALELRLPTIGVLGHGLDTLFPPEHKGLMERMLEQGGVLTEFVSGTPPLPPHFPLRNRIVAGLSDAVVVVEAKRRGGALISANLGFSYNREVFAYPGRVTDLCSEGCNHLIRSNKAALLQRPSEVAEALGWAAAVPSGERPDTPLRLPFELDFKEQRVYEEVARLTETDADTLAEACSFSVPELSVLLLSLECKGVVQRVAGQRYRCR